MPLFGNDPAEEEDDLTFDEVSAMADRLQLQGDARVNYIDDHMRQLGYDAVQTKASYARRVDPQQQQQPETAASRWGFGRQQQGQQGQRPPANSGRQNPPNDDGF